MKSMDPSSNVRGGGKWSNFLSISGSPKSGNSNDGSNSPATSSINTDLLTNGGVGRGGGGDLHFDKFLEHATGELRSISISGRPTSPPVQEEDVEGREGQESEANEEESEEDSSSEEVSGSDEGMSWIAWFTSLKGNEFFCEIDEEYIQDDFNLTGLSNMVPYYDYALDMVLDVQLPIESLTEEQQEVVETAAEMLYGLIHARYILTSRGMQAMLEKYQHSHFGRCPRVFCQSQSVLPIGLSDNPRMHTVFVFCPKCQDVYIPRSTRQACIDGAYFGTTFSHLFLLTHPDLIPPKPEQKYVSKIYGFKIHKDSEYHRSREEPEKKKGGGGKARSEVASSRLLR